MARRHILFQIVEQHRDHCNEMKRWQVRKLGAGIFAENWKDKIAEGIVASEKGIS